MALHNMNKRKTDFCGGAEIGFWFSDSQTMPHKECLVGLSL
ncbi:hypothetical protein RUMCAL_02244 [Ruminococcus callidus ATCC 27760]|jgi:hypothetical protein|uniref:Uncharacterized protein n=1 Tax=Ruminococcus callidus ATCC 27760 TaxID=411473 RepID=U2LW70_9FIRM|nr:hypothetical protein RUMCAL_02244 [Ruminococcus callidus ATCC 27760]